MPTIPSCLPFCRHHPQGTCKIGWYTLKMDSGNVVIDSDMAYPILFIPKKCTTLETNCELKDNVYIDVSITSRDSEGHHASIYIGFCNIKLVDSYGVNVNRVESPATPEPDIDQMPIILSEANQLHPYNESQVWIDPSRSPYVYNHYDPSVQQHYDPAVQEQYSIRESGGLITVEQHNTYITQNVYNCKEPDMYNYTETRQSPVKDFECKVDRKVQEMSTTQPESNLNYYEEDEFECGVFLSQLPEEIMNEKKTMIREENIPVQENCALEQLMSSDIQSTSKQRKTILFLGHDSDSGQTIQNISYNDPMIKCAEMEVDNEVVIDTSSPNPKKKYQCDKCKQIFDQISSFRQHMVGNHTNFKLAPQPDKEISFLCTDCGKHLKNQHKFEIHCLGHGDPDLECPKCRKVFASKFSLRVHQKIHNREHPCTYCIKSYDSFEELRMHLEKVHSVYICHDKTCSFVSGKPSDLDNHQHWHKPDEPQIDNHPDDFVTAKLESEVEILSQELMDSTQDMTGSNEDLSESNPDLSNQYQDVPGHDMPELHQDLSSSSNDFTRSSVNLNSREEVISVDDNEGERIRQADSVIAKVMSTELFLLSSKKARKHRCRKACGVCHKTFGRIDDLKRHLIEHVIKSTLAKTPVSHTGSLNIICEVCQTETFNKVDKYKTHLREHAKLTIYKCTFCDKSFSDSSNFSKHKKIHGAAFLRCDLCNRKFHSKKMIAQHIEQHNKTSPVTCSFCQKTFHFESMLNKHIRCAHRKEESLKFRCRFCDGIFKSLKEKWEHEWCVHNVRKMIVDCLICGSQYRKYSDLKRHCLDDHDMDIPPAKKLLKKKYSRAVSFD